jgi:hypothetical protein
MKANNNNNNSTNSGPTPPNLPEASDAFLSYTAILSESYNRQAAGGSSSPPPLPVLQSGPGGKSTITRKKLLATLDEALAILSDDSDSLDSVSDAGNSL